MNSQPTALVADDNVDSALTLAALLELLGQTVRVVHNGDDAVNAANEERPRIIFLDIGMPGLDGWEACRRIRAIQWDARPRIFAITGYGTPDARERSRAAGFDSHLLKPLALSVVSALIAE